MNEVHPDSEQQPLRTPLSALHEELGARMVPFAGYLMPVQYPGGIIAEHNHTRSAASLFDVSHMGQVRLTGAGAAAAMERLVPVDVVDLAPGRQRYAMFTNETGGILDDLMIVNAGDSLFVVVNAACKHEDIEHMRAHLADDCMIKVLDDRGLLALQGPGAEAAMGAIGADCTTLGFMHATTLDIGGVECFVSRSGYTGEDGFEISVPADQTEALARRLLAVDGVAAAGLGARDSLRLEAGLCLYGHDIDTQTTPVEADLRWALSRVRRAGGARAGGYPGAAQIQAHLDGGAGRRRGGLRPEGRAPVRDGAELRDHEGTVVGQVTSGGFAPSVGRPVAMGYVSAECAEPGQQLSAMVRGKPLPVRVAQMPFVAHQYRR